MSSHRSATQCPPDQMGVHHPMSLKMNSKSLFMFSNSILNSITDTRQCFLIGLKCNSAS